MSTLFRQAAAGRIDRSKPLRFTFDGRSYTGFAGDTLASALLANGVHLFGRSFKLHRPRGVLASGSDEPNALVAWRRDASRYTPNLRATQLELFEGLVADSQNRWPSLRFDVGALAGLFARVFSAGFYYKTFMWPAGAWHRLYEPCIRAAAGLGRAPDKPDPDQYSQRYAYCDLLVVGAGPAGLAAALAGAATGATVVLCDEQAELGGSLLAEDITHINGQPADAWLTEAVRQLSARPNVTLLPRTTAFGYYPHNMLGLAERLTDHLAGPAPGQARERLWHVRAVQVVLATGAIERPLVFPGNDRPGVMLADAARTFLTRYGVLPGKRTVLATAHDGAYRTALALKDAGVEVAAIVDLRPQADGELPQRARAAGIPVHVGSSISDTRGRWRVRQVEIKGIKNEQAQRLECDLVLMSAGWTPVVHLFSQSRGQLRFDETLAAFVPAQSAEAVRSVGACRGVFGLAAALADGQEAGAAAVGVVTSAAYAVTDGYDAPPGVYLGGQPIVQRSGGKAFVDFQNDVTEDDVLQAVREGFHSIEHVKRYTTTGMATDQGKTSNMNALGIVSQALELPLPAVGLTTFRPPYTPTTFGSLAGLSRGALFEPLRTTPIDEWAAQQGAAFENVGQWRRAHYFPRPGEDKHAAVARECLAVRQAAGIFDASTLGKIEVVGKDAAEFLNRMYVNSWSKLAPRRLRYGVLLRENGFIYDDGVVARVAADRFHVTTTTGGAAGVMQMMEDYRQTEWPNLEVWLTSVTEQWAVIAVQGPKARSILQPLFDDIDLSAEAMPHMSMAEGHILGVPTRLFRVSFTGELGFEINVPADYGRAVWEAVFEAGQPMGLTPYGTETMHVLRAEKGYIVVGQDTDGTVTPHDAGLQWAIGKGKRDFVGKRALALPALTDTQRPQLVGLLTDDPQQMLETGMQIVASAELKPPSLGFVTSAYWSATLNRTIALGLVVGGHARHGEKIYVCGPHGGFPVTVGSPVLFDSEGGRLHA